MNTLTELYDRLKQEEKCFTISLNQKQFEFFKKELIQRIENINVSIENITDLISEHGSNLKEFKQRKKDYEEMLKQLSLVKP